MDFGVINFARMNGLGNAKYEEKKNNENYVRMVAGHREDNEKKVLIWE